MTYNNSAFTPELVGRENEQKQLLERLEECVKEQQGGTLIITGEPGTGKTRLLAELRKMALDRGFLIASNCWVGHDVKPYAGLVRLIESCLKFDTVKLA